MFGNFSQSPALSQGFEILRIFEIFVLLCISTIGTASNIFIIAVSVASRRQIRPVHILLVHLAATDLIICALIAPLLTYSFFEPIPFHSDVLCNIVIWAYYTCVSLVLGTQFAITINRYASCNINNQWSRHVLSAKGAFSSIYLSWLSVGVLYILPAAAYNELLCYDYHNFNTCIPCGDFDQYNIGIIIATVNTLITLCVIFCMYLKIAISFKKMQSRVLETNKTTNKISKNTAVLLLAFAVCYGPSVIIQPFYFSISFVALTVIDILYKFNSILNPFLYAFRLPLYRQALRKCVCRYNTVAPAISGTTSLSAAQ